MAQKKYQEEKDTVAAREINFQEFLTLKNKEYEREIENAEMENKGEKILKKIQGQELRKIFEEHKQLRLEWKKAKFLPTKAKGGICLSIKLMDIFTTTVSVDVKTKKLVVEVVAKNPKIPVNLEDYVGSLDFSPVKFNCDVWFNVGKVDWSELKVSNVHDQANGVLNINIARIDGDSMWLNKAEIFAKYKNGWKFW